MHFEAIIGLLVFIGTSIKFSGVFQGPFASKVTMYLDRTEVYLHHEIEIVEEIVEHAL